MNLLKSFYNSGVYPNQDTADIKMIRTVNLLLALALICVVFTALFGYYIQKNDSSLYALLSLPIFLIGFYMNYRRKVLTAITIIFLSSSLLLTVYSLRAGEDAYTHMLFV